MKSSWRAYKDCFKSGPVAEAIPIPLPRVDAGAKSIDIRETTSHPNGHDGSYLAADADGSSENRKKEAESEYFLLWFKAVIKI